MFQGTYAFRIDQKGRLVIPQPFRQEFRSGLVLFKSIDPAIALYPASLWNELSRGDAATPFSPSRERRIGMRMFASAFTEEMDAQGRVLLPSLLREYAGIQEEVIVVGAGRYVALWSPERWRRQSRELDEQAWRDAEERRTSP